MFYKITVKWTFRLCLVVKKFEGKCKKKKKKKKKSGMKEKVKKNKNGFKINKLFLYIIKKLFYFF